MPQVVRPPAPPTTGIDYLGMVVAAHNDASSGSITYRDPTDVDPHTTEEL